MFSILTDIPVMYVASNNGPADASIAFNKLESKLSSLKGRKFYGIFQNGDYKACVAITEFDDPNNLGLPTYTILGGKYAKSKILNWEKHTKQIASKFEQLALENKIDTARPSIEFYRSQKELILFAPIF